MEHLPTAVRKGAAVGGILSMPVMRINGGGFALGNDVYDNGGHSMQSVVSFDSDYSVAQNGRSREPSADCETIVSAAKLKWRSLRFRRRVQRATGSLRRRPQPKGLDAYPLRN